MDTHRAKCQKLHRAHKLHLIVNILNFFDISVWLLSQLVAGFPSRVNLSESLSMLTIPTSKPKMP